MISKQIAYLPMILWQNSAALLTFLSWGLSGICTGFSGLAINLGLEFYYETTRFFPELYVTFLVSSFVCQSRIWCLWLASFPPPPQNQEQFPRHSFSNLSETIKILVFPNSFRKCKYFKQLYNVHAFLCTILSRLW